MNKDNIMTVLVSVVASVAVSALIATSTAKNDATGGESMDKAVEAYLMNNPLKVREALELAARQEQIEAQKRVAEAYKANLKDLHDGSTSPFVGPKDAKITIVEFFDFNCGYCKRLAPAMMKVIKNNPDVKFVFKPVTFLGSMPIAKAAMAANEQGKFLEVYEALLSHNGPVTNEVIEETFKNAGLDVAKSKELMESDKVKNNLSTIAELSQKVEIRGVPTLIINGEPLPAIEEGPIQAAIDNLK